jgi:ABC-type sugar transport system permease subunit/ABC-type glycerol-3-phosphate transport system substrate-binding protein
MLEGVRSTRAYMKFLSFTRLRRFDPGPFTLGTLSLIVLLAAWALYPKSRLVQGRDDVTEIVYWTTGTASEADKLAIAEFERRNPQYRVELGTATVKNHTGDPTRFLLGVAGGVPPDVIFFDRFAVVEWASRGAFTDLTPFMERDRDKPGAISPDNFFAPAWNEAVYKDRLYAIPNSADTRAMFYNEDALIRAGLVYENDDAEVLRGEKKAGSPRPPKTWEEICRKRLHARGTVLSGSSVRLAGFERRPDGDESNAGDVPVNLLQAGVRAGDVVALIDEENVFRARIASVEDGGTLTLDLAREQAPGLLRIPPAFNSGFEIKIFDQDSYVHRLSRFDPDTGQLAAAGFIPLYGNSWLYMFGWLNGARYMSDDGAEVRLNSREVVEALQYVVDVYDALGGYESASVFQAGAESGPIDPFLVGKVAMFIMTDGFLSTITAFRPDLKFGVVPSPIPEARRAAGYPSYGWIGGWSYGIPVTARNKEAAWAFVTWMSSLEAMQLKTEYMASVGRATGKVFFPFLQHDRRMMAWVTKTYLEDNPQISPELREAFDVFVNLLPTSKHRPVTPVGQKLWSEQVRAMEAAISHVKPPYDALSYGNRRVQIALDRSIHPPQGQRVPWVSFLVLYIAGVITLFGALAFVQHRRTRRAGGSSWRWLEGYACASPWLLGFIVFGGGPILFSVIISFCRYDVLNPAEFIGWTNYVNLLGRHMDDVLQAQVWNDPIFWKSLANTGFMIIGVPLGIIGGLALALLLNANVRGMRLYRTIYYLPAIVPAVATFILWLWVFDPGRGLMNMALRAAGITNLPAWLQNPVWAKPSLILMGLWGLGSGMIIWLAGLKDIPESMYESASIDGANRWQRFCHITIPLLTPYIFFHLIMGMIGVFQIFEAAYIMTEGGPADSTMFYAYKLFNEAFRFLNMGVASAMAWLLFIVVLAITLFQLWLGKRWVHYGGE